MYDPISGENDLDFDQVMARIEEYLGAFGNMNLLVQYAEDLLAERLCVNCGVVLDDDEPDLCYDCQAFAAAWDEAQK